LKNLLLALLIWGSTTASAIETITIASPYSPSHSGTPAMFRIVEEANQSQKKYNFILDFKPGGEQIIAVKFMDDRPQSRLAVIAPKFVEHTRSGKLTRNDYVPIHALGDACWAVITNTGNMNQGVASLRGQQELTVGGVGIGNAAHITALELGEQFSFSIRYIPFKSNFDALILLVSDQSINMVVERVSSYKQYQEKNPNVTVLGMSCPTRHPDLPQVKTLLEQGINAPYVFNITVANKTMPEPKRKELATILNIATLKVGEKEIQKLSDMTPPIFRNQSIDDYYNKRVEFMEKLLKKYESKF
jgi:tripartite-type tricarboxylate transporter receptor subunit TctC